MSIELNWDTLTSGPDGAALAERIREFIHGKFQTVPLPRFIKSVTVHGFDFGTIPPQLELKDITDPLPDFYDEEIGDDESDDEADEGEHRNEAHEREKARRLKTERLKNEMGAANAAHWNDMSSPFLGVSTPGLLGGPPGLGYFQGQFGTGTHTPLAAVAGAHLGSSWIGSAGPDSPDPGYGPSPSHSRNPSQSLSSISAGSFTSHGGLEVPHALREKSSVSTLAPTASSVGTSRPPTRDALAAESAIEEEDNSEQGAGGESPPRPRKEPRVEDVQAVFRIRYAGDVRLNLTAEILLDYPMPSFVGIPLKLNITGMAFDGVGVLANIRKRVHFCFLSPDDAWAAVGPDEDEDEGEGEGEGGEKGGKHGTRFGGLLQEIKVESEIGERDGGKQSLKNVGKVERFVLEQVRRIFEEEFVYPSFWTFLV